jgi:hypothetical protein
VFDGAELPTAGERQHVNHLALPVDTLEEFDAAYQRLKDHGVTVTEIIERGYGKTFYFHDPNGIRLQIELKTKQDADSLEGDPDPVPYVRALLQRLVLPTAPPTNGAFWSGQRPIRSVNRPSVAPARLRCRFARAVRTLGRRALAYLADGL